MPQVQEQRVRIEKDAYRANQVQFEPVPTQMSYTEYAYDSHAQELKVHIWLFNTPMTLRHVWERLAESFGPSALKWTDKAEIVVPFDPYKLTGSIFVGMKATPQQAVNVIKRIIEIDRSMLSLKT
jgi:hypothetical protein